MSKGKEKGVRVKAPFGLKNTRIVVLADGRYVYFWKLRWWYAIYQAFRMAVQTCLCADLYSEWSSEDLENMDK